ncbi:MAG: hypothetical protein K9L23_20800 [Desulfotignum sp.]|nr:hypothetical protein [Desulfotignum sp.]
MDKKFQVHLLWDTMSIQKLLWSIYSGLRNNMKLITPVRDAYRIQFRSFIPFLLISFGVAWYAFLMIGLPLIFIGDSASWGHMGSVASACIPVKRNPAERVVVHCILCRMPVDQRHCNGTVQQVSWQHPAVCILPFLTYESDLS